MPYTTLALLQTEIPLLHLVSALDDDGDGSMDAGVLDALIASASQAVDALLAARYEVPFTDEPFPAAVCEAAFVFAGEKVYLRRGAEQNPFKVRADFWRGKLAAIARGEMELDAAAPAANTPGAVITETPGIDGGTG